MVGGTSRHGQARIRDPLADHPPGLSSPRRRRDPERDYVLAHDEHG